MTTTKSKPSEFDLRPFRALAVNAKDSEATYSDRTGTKKVSNLADVILTLLSYIETSN